MRSKLVLAAALVAPRAPVSAASARGFGGHGGFAVPSIRGFRELRWLRGASVASRGFYRPYFFPRPYYAPLWVALLAPVWTMGFHRRGTAVMAATVPYSYY